MAICGYMSSRFLKSHSTKHEMASNLHLIEGFPRNVHIFCLCVYRTYPPSYHMYPRIALFVSCTHTSPCLSHCIVRGFHRYVDIVCVRVYRTYLLSYISVLCTRAPVRAPGKEYPFFYLGAPVQLKYAKYTKNDSGL